MGVLVIYNVQLTADELALIGSALDLLPHGKVAPLVARVQAQINAQEQAAKEAANPVPVSTPLPPAIPNAAKPKSKAA